MDIQLSTNSSASESIQSSWKSIFWVGGIAALILLGYSLLTMVSLIVIGGQPGSAQEGFSMLQNNRLLGLLRLDLPTTLVMPLYYLLLLGLYAALKKTERAPVTLAAILGFAGITLFLSAPSALSWLALSDRFASAAGEAQKAQFLAAGEAILAADMWHGASALLGGLLLQISLLLISIFMLRSEVFGKPLAYLGILMHGLDLAHLLIGLFIPTGGVILMAIAGPLYLLWFPLIARRFFQLADQKLKE